MAKTYQLTCTDQVDASIKYRFKTHYLHCTLSFLICGRKCSLIIGRKRQGLEMMQRYEPPFLQAAACHCLHPLIESASPAIVTPVYRLYTMVHNGRWSSVAVHLAAGVQGYENACWAYFLLLTIPKLTQRMLSL